MKDKPVKLEVNVFVLSEAHNYCKCTLVRTRKAQLVLQVCVQVVFELMSGLEKYHNEVSLIIIVQVQHCI